MTTFAVFAFLWALSALLDLVTADAWLRSPAHALLPAAAVLVLLRPTSLAGFLAFDVLLVAALGFDSPHTANHQFLFLVAGVAILLAFFQAALRGGRGWRVDPRAWLDAFAPVLRTLVVLMYLFAVFHKLNRDYLLPSASCAVALFAMIEENWGVALLPDTDAAHSFMIYGSLGTEALIPVLLVWRRTRWLGVALGVLFHTLLGIRFYAFSTGLLALYVLFVPRAALEGAASAARALRARTRMARLLSPRLAQALALAIVAGLAAAWPYYQDPSTRASAAAVARVLRSLWALGIVAGLSGLLLARDARAHWLERVPGRAWPTGPAWLFPAVVVFSGMSPYLGMRTVPSFSMFSNLHTEGGVSNHVIVPAGALEIAGYQRDLVTVLATNWAPLDSFRRRGLRLVYHDFRRRIQNAVAARGPGGRPVYVAFRRGGRRFVVPDAAKDPELMAEISWWQHKWLRFRPIPPRGRACAW